MQAMAAERLTRLPAQDRSDSDCLYPLRSLASWVFAGVHSARPGEPPKQ